MYESWTQTKSDININGYKSFNFYRKFQNRRANRCSGGIVLYIKDCISDGIKIVRNHFDSVIWLQLDKNFSELRMMYLLQEFIFGEKVPPHIMLSMSTSLIYYRLT